MISNKDRFRQAITLIDQENQQDPHSELSNGQQVPKELLYSERMTNWLEKFNPKASEELRLAARSQHICRWTIPRESYPMDRKGYLLWRTELKKFHAQKAETILLQCGYNQEVIDRVKSLILKQRLKTDKESQTLEDVVCLVFLEFYFSEFAQKHPEEKVISIVQKTWNKMSVDARKVAMELNLPPADFDLIQKAIG
ncbi:MAG: hypothetical protein DHS20C17_34380 [Cyclobacteriaceae bacterium]|nr:MAG: hypothetical protein DHS20C17_34380 [Cyclobacteriaceae bacterium]